MNNFALIICLSTMAQFGAGQIVDANAAASTSPPAKTDAHQQEGGLMRKAHPAPTADSVLLRLAQNQPARNGTGISDQINSILSGEKQKPAFQPRRNSSPQRPYRRNQAVKPPANPPANQPANPPRNLTSAPPPRTDEARRAKRHNVWSGFWWPLKYAVSERMYSQNGPAAKYDAYMQRLTGRNPGWRRWERNNHDGQNTPGWFGHCHAVTAASILEREPRRAKTRKGVTFSVLDQKALLTEAHYNDPALWFKGQRYNGSGDSFKDPSPHVMHWLLLNWIGYTRGRNESMDDMAAMTESSTTSVSSNGFAKLEGAAEFGQAPKKEAATERRRRRARRYGRRKPFVMDKNPGPQVWNYVVNGYTMWYKRSRRHRNSWIVKVKVNYADFAGHERNFVGVKKASQIYTYWIRGRSFRRPSSGGWTGKSRKNHPDFFWYPSYARKAPGSPISYRAIKNIVK